MSASCFSLVTPDVPARRERCRAHRALPAVDDSAQAAVPVRYVQMISHHVVATVASEETELLPEAEGTLHGFARRRDATRQRFVREVGHADLDAAADRDARDL